MEPVIISVDLGGTQIRAARLNTKLELLERVGTLTLAHEGLEPTLGRIKEQIRKVLPQDGSKVLGIGISAPGPLNPRTGVIIYPPNLDGWHNVPLSKILQDEFDVPVYLGNDANVAALAETVSGAARGARNVVFITVSTGVGGGLIEDGSLILGRDGLGAEVGHTIMIVADGKVSSFEKEAAGPAIAAKVVERLKDGARSAITDEIGDDYTKVDAKLVGKYALEGDVLAREIVEYSAHITGLGIVSLLHLFNPEIVVIGGGVSSIGDMYFDKVQSTIHDHVLDDNYLHELPIVPAKLGGDVSIIGAATLVITKGGHDDITLVSEQVSEVSESE